MNQISLEFAGILGLIILFFAFYGIMKWVGK